MTSRSIGPCDGHLGLAVEGDSHAGIAAVGVDIVVKGALMHYVGAVQFLDGDEELFPCRGIKVVVVAEHLRASLLADDIAVLIDEGALFCLWLGDDELCELAFLVEGVILTAVIATLDALAMAMITIDGRILDCDILALALLEGKSQHRIIGVSVIHHGLAVVEQ